VSNQDIEGDAPAGEAPGAAPGTPEYFEQQLAKERDARVQMRDRLRHTEALAAEANALRSRMAQELERVTADRDRLRSAAAQPSTAPGASAEVVASPSPPRPTPRMGETPRFGEAPLKPPPSARRSGPWRALAMLGALAAGVAVFAWYSGSQPGANEAATASAPQTATATATAPAASAAVVATANPATPAPAASVPAALAAAATPAPAALPGEAVALPSMTPEQVLAAEPAAAGSAAAAAPAGMSARLRTALAREGVAAPVDIDAATGHVTVADPAADHAARDRTDMVIRAVYAGAGLPEPQIEHRWLSPMRAALASPASTPVQDAAAAYAARHAAAEHAQDHRRKPAEPALTVADAEALRPVLPAGRINAGCRADATSKSTAQRNAGMRACMKHSCCSAANRQTEECRAWDKAYPFTCGAV
jgi:hypothetical protein